MGNNNYISDIFWSEIIIIILSIISLLYTFFHVVRRYKYFLIYKKEESIKFSHKKNDGDKKDIIYVWFRQSI